MISVKNVRKSYSTDKVTHEVLRGVDLEIPQGEFVSLVGRSGSGKTTLLNIVGGLDTHYDGLVEVDGQNLRDLSEEALSDYRNRKIGFVFQSFHLLEHLSCVDNVALPAQFSRGDRAITEEAARERAVDVLKQVDLADKLDARPASLSGGQKQRVAIARALFGKPTIILCDEPTGNLDMSTGAAILDLFRALNEEQQITLLIVTHEDPISRAARRVVRIQDGVLMEDSARLSVKEPHSGEPGEGDETGKSVDRSGGEADVT